MVSSINSDTRNSIVLPDSQQGFIQATEQKTTQNNQKPLSNPTENIAKTAQTSSDIVISSGKNLNQVVIEKNAPLQEMDKNQALNRDLGVIDTTSPTGAQADMNALPPDISAKSEF